ncbi:YbaB/EbfC family nucleoid-associated protein [bacterium]|nr:YbaB/EbfC family nucleoid-associated protein [bacterium]
MNKNILKQMQKMQQKMQMDLASAQKELEESTVEGMSGGGAVKIVMTGSQEIKSVKISKDAVDPEDVETLEDLVMVAFKDALAKSRDLSNSRMGKVTAGLNLPSGLSGLF